MTRLTLAFALCALLSPAAAFATPRHQPVRSQAGTAGTVCTDTPKLGYSGNGALIQNVKVVDVFYSPGHKYKAMLESFYGGILQSAHFDWLSEYNVPNYKIGRGTFVSSFEDTNPNPATVKVVDPEVYLKGLVTAGKLPPPDDDTMYMLYFPSGVDPTDGNGSSCISNGDFCAYHSSFQASGGQMVRYGVIPDMEAGSCSMGCGPAGFPSFTDVSSHELVEAVTDPDGTGWYDVGAPESSKDNCGEIGDICATGGTGETATINGFIVQKEWSNKNNACIGSDPNVVVNDYTIAAAPVDVSVPIGGSATVTVTLTKTTGVADNVTLTAPLVPTGLTATFAPASVTSAGGTSMLTIGAVATLTAGATFTVTVKGTTAAKIGETAQVNVTVVAPADMAMPASGGSGGTGGGGAGGGSGGGGAGGGNGNHGGDSGCSVGGGSFAGSWAFAGLLLLALAFRRRRA